MKEKKLKRLLFRGKCLPLQSLLKKYYLIY